MTTMRIGSWTPWGPAADVEQIAPGIVSVGTASHGGIHLDAELNRKIHPVWRDSAGWYEEDSEASIVVATFPEAFTSRLRRGMEAVHDSLAYWHPEQHRTAFPEEAATRAGRETSDDVTARLRAEAEARATVAGQR